MNFTLKLNQQSLKNVLREIERRGGDIKRAGKLALRAEAENIMTEAKRQTPVDTGALKSTGHVFFRHQARRLSAILAFGGPAVNYAVYVHEDLTARHKVGNAKFLENPIKAAIPRLVQRLASLIKREL